MYLASVGQPARHLEVASFSLEEATSRLEVGAWSLEAASFGLEEATSRLKVGAWSLGGWSLEVASFSLEEATSRLNVEAWSLGGWSLEPWRLEVASSSLDQTKTAPGPPEHQILISTLCRALCHWQKKTGGCCKIGTSKRHSRWVCRAA